jgi:AraC family transcriptional regulator of arabinose operon
MDHDEELDNFWPENIKVGAVNYPPGGTLGPRIQQTFEFVFIHQGDMSVYIDEQPIYSDTNTTTLLFPGHQEYFRFSKHSNTFHSYLHIALPNLSTNFNQRLINLPKVIPTSQKMTLLVQDALDMRSTGLPTKSSMLKSLSILIFWFFIGEAERFCKDAESTSTQNVAEKARQFIEEHLLEDITLENIAKSSCVCPEHLIKVFKLEIGQTPISYLWKKRVAMGIDLLEHSGLSISTIADRCGFKTRNHFSRRVLQYTGSSPKDVRQKYWHTWVKE